MIQVTHHSDCTFQRTYVHMHETRSNPPQNRKKVFLQVGFSFSQAPVFRPPNLAKCGILFFMATMPTTSSMPFLRTADKKEEIDLTASRPQMHNFCSLVLGIEGLIEKDAILELARGIEAVTGHLSDFFISQLLEDFLGSTPALRVGHLQFKVSDQEW